MHFSADKFHQRILDWYDHHGRKDLPWQKNKTPYRVWLSEVMLQQTQVKTVIPYFQKFIKNFPTTKKLAQAQLDEVLKHWAGLGFYARARNLHRTAQIIQSEYNGKFPTDLLELQKLPGIGRSTAGAIVSLSMNQSAPILDGNVKRVLTRLFAIDSFPYDSKTQKELWQLAENLTPRECCADYTQAMMDLGATVCTPDQPKCKICPVNKFCLGYKEGKPETYPVAKPGKKIPERSIQLLILYNSKDEILLEKRPPIGIWGGLWSLPETQDEDIVLWGKKNYHCTIGKIKHLSTFKHAFSHFHLHITPVLAQVKKWQPPLMESSAKVWYKLAQLEEAGLPAPVKTILQQLTQQTYDTHHPLPKTKKRSTRA